MKQTEKLVAFKLLAISSPAFRDGDKMPARFTCDGLNISPPIEIRQVPEETQSLALIMDDPDAPRGTWVHWVVWNIPVTHLLKENEVHGVEGMNDFQRHHYGGPCPPSGMHRYFFKVYALDTVLELPASAGKTALEEAMSDHIIGFGEMVGLYKRNK
ncbi:MAG: YbhB/YbcL family Raf kinase inhibitor-like protein [Ferruginibacter sp.]